MDIYIKFVQQYELDSIYLAYYNFFEKMYGKTLVGKLTKKNMQSGEEVSPLVAAVDSNYQRAISAVESVYGEVNYVMIGAYNFENQLLAVGRVKFGVPGNVCNAVMGEIIILDEQLPLSQRFDLYSVFIKNVEEMLSDPLSSIDVLTFEVPYGDYAYETAVMENGYNLSDDGTSKYMTSLYDKNLKEKECLRTLENNAPTE